MTDDGFPVRFRFQMDGKLFNLGRLQVKSKVHTDVLDELLYSDYVAKNASTEKMQAAMDRVSQANDNYDLKISTKKIAVVYQPAHGKPYSEPISTLNGQRLQVVDKFILEALCLEHIDDEVTARIAKTSVALGRLRGNVWDRSGIRLDTQLKDYIAIVLPTLLYACETWTVYQQHAKRLNHFHLNCLRKPQKFRSQDEIPETYVLKRAGMQSCIII